MGSFARPCKHSTPKKPPTNSCWNVLCAAVGCFPLQTSEKGKATLALIQSRGSSSGTLSVAVAAAAADDDDSRDWADLYEDYLDAELEEDEEIESYYFSSAAGRARVVLGNRRWGEGGYMRAGAAVREEGRHAAVG